MFFRFLRLLLFGALALLMVGLVFKERPRVLLNPAAELAMRFVLPAQATNGSVTLVINEGASGADVANSMANQGLITNALLFRALMAYYDIDRNLKAGSYTFPPGTDLRAILDALGDGSQAGLEAVTILEGWRAEQVADYLDSKGIARREEFLELVIGDPQNLSGKVLGWSARSLEGYLFPDTYLVPKEYGAGPFVMLMLNTFKERFSPRYQEVVRASAGAIDGGRLLTPAEVVTLASIVEREVRMPEERALTAGLFLRRIAFGMQLAADPTIQYALVPPGSPSPFVGYWKRDLHQDDLRLASPYNTYVQLGLPPGPICNPGLASLTAALHPAQTNALYFVAKPDGSHAFATTFEEHQANITLYRR